MNKLQRGDKLIMFDGQKAVTIWGDTGWESHSPDVKPNTAEWLSARVPIIYRGMTIRANTVASIPFDMVNERGDVIDSTDDWQNVIGFLHNPETLFWLIEAAWTITGQAYLYQSKNSSRIVKILRPLAPGGVSWNDNKQLFERAGSPPKYYPAAVSPEGVLTKDLESIVYLWQPDPSVEWGVPSKYPGLAALHAMGVLYNMDEAAVAFFKRGMMKITAFVVPPGTQEVDKLAFEEKVNQTLTGMKNFFRTIFLRAGQVQPVDLGGGLEGLANVPLTKEKREDVSIALGVPMSKLFTESAAGLGGGGVVQADDKRLILDTGLPEWKNIARMLNRQVFSPLGYRLVERHEKMDEFQQSENERSSALSALVGAFSVNPKLALVLAPEVGIELSEEAVGAIEGTLAEKEAEPAPVPVAPVPATPVVPDDAPEMEDAEAVKYAAELMKFQRKALKHIGEAVKFESDIIPAGVLLDIQGKLPNCTTADEVKGLFSRHATGKATQAAHDEADELAAQMKRALDFLERAESVKYSDNQPRDENGRFASGGGIHNPGDTNNQWVFPAQFGAPEISVNLPEEVIPFYEKYGGEDAREIAAGIVRPLPSYAVDAYELGRKLRAAGYTSYNGAIDVAWHEHGYRGDTLIEDVCLSAGITGAEMPYPVIGWRYGDIPSGGTSWNRLEGRVETGTSVMGVFGGGHTYDMLSTARISSSRPMVLVAGYLNTMDNGGDSEPLIINPKVVKK